MADFEVKDSGARKVYASGMQRDTDENKIMYDLVFDGPLFERLAQHLTKGARKYEPRNWMKANGPEELARFRASATRHFVQWLRGDTDEDHAMAVVFNINAALYVQDIINRNTPNQCTALEFINAQRGDHGLPPAE